MRMHNVRLRSLLREVQTRDSRYVPNWSPGDKASSIPSKYRYLLFILFCTRVSFP